MDSEDLTEGKVFATFDKFEEFSALQTEFLDTCRRGDIDEAKDEVIMLKKLSNILDEYQEQAYLLDPFLEQLVNPVVECLKSCVQAPSASGVEATIGQLSVLLYKYIKFRGYKSITRFFPHEIADLSITLDFLLLPNGPAQQLSHWPLRYVMLLWLSLICRIPFDLTQFDEPENLGKTASDLEEVAKSYLGKAGLEREGAAILLSRFYSRKDMNAKLPAFLQWSIEIMHDPKEPFACIGSLQVLSELCKTAFGEQIESHFAAILQIASLIDENPVLTNNTLMRKFRIKLASRVLLRLLPSRIVPRRSRGKRMLSDMDESDAEPNEEDTDIPEETEDVLQDLFKALQDKDTVVRYSSAKGIARIAERLPAEFTEQVLDTVLQLFSVHSMGAASLYDMPSIAEATWHGASLACAEMARRGLIPDSRLGELLDWMKKALYFDIRKGAHSVGSNVRDAASYVLWSLARAQSVDALAPFADALSHTLVAVSVFDREIHIRRAASAAFQEFVGRTSLFAHGIDVLRKTDFYAVGTRRHAYLVAAYEVAEHKEYRPCLIEHLILVTLRHWDPVVRQLGAQSLRVICQRDLTELAPTCAKRVAEYLTFADPSDVHGALLALAELASALESIIGDHRVQAERRKIFLYLAQVPTNMVQSRRHELITASACTLIAHSISLPEIETSSENSGPQWRDIIDFALKSTSSVVQEAAADAMGTVSKLANCSADVQRFIREGETGQFTLQQSICRVLGVLDYKTHAHGLLPVIQFLVGCVDRSSPTALKNVEARRNAYISMTQILQNMTPDLSKHISCGAVCCMFACMLAGLEDYTTDERGDVGSWIRIVCVKGLASFAEVLITDAAAMPNFAEYLPASRYHDAVAGILKQGVERLDNVRQQAGEQLLRLLVLPSPAVPQSEAWLIEGDHLMKELFLSDKEPIGWNEGAWLFPRVTKLLTFARYRDALLSGLVLSASSRTDSTQRPVSASLVAYAHSLPIKSDGTSYDRCSLAADLLAQAKRNLASNNVVIPVLQTFNVLLEGDAFEDLGDDPGGLKSLQALLSITSRNISRLKNVQRILISMRIVINLLCMSPLLDTCIATLPDFLAHAFPKIRTDTAEYLYLILQSKDLGHDTDEAEEVILETEWSSSDMNGVTEAAERCAELLVAGEGGR